jgi:hypothetical protein
MAKIRARSKSPAAKKKKSRSKSRSKSKSSGSDKVTALVNADQALKFDTLCRVFYTAAFFGAMGNPHQKFFGTESVGGPLCNGLPEWMGVVNATGALNNIAVLRNGTDLDKKRLNLTHSTQWAAWFLMIMAIGRTSYAGGAFVPSEYYAGLAVCFANSLLSRHGSETTSMASVAFDKNNKVTQCFLGLFIIALVNTFNVGVMGGEEYFQGEATSQQCRAHTAMFASFIFLLGCECWEAHQGLSKASKKAYLLHGMIAQVVFLGLTVKNAAAMGRMVNLNYLLCAVQFGLGYRGWKLC